MKWGQWFTTQLSVEMIGTKPRGTVQPNLRFDLDHTQHRLSTSGEPSPSGGGLPACRYSSLLPEVQFENALYLLYRLRMFVSAMVCLHKRFGTCPCQMRTPIGHNAIGTVLAVPESSIADDRMKRRRQRDRQIRQGDQTARPFHHVSVEVAIAATGRRPGWNKSKIATPGLLRPDGDAL